MAVRAALPRGRRALVRGEHLWVGKPHRGRKHVYAQMTGAWGTVVACGLCGRIRDGESMPESWPANTR